MSAVEEGICMHIQLQAVILVQLYAKKINTDVMSTYTGVKETVHICHFQGNLNALGREEMGTTVTSLIIRSN